MSKTAKEIAINTEYITLGQLLKFADVISWGGEAKSYLATHEVIINDEPDNRRGRKLRVGDVVELSEGTFKITQE